MQNAAILTVSLGKAITAPVLIPVIHESTPSCINDPFLVQGRAYGVTCVSFGSPHGAVLVENVDSVDVPEIGTALGTHPLFPRGASIVFVQITGKSSLKARLWQRGEGEIPFTPEAACVAAAAAIMLQKITKHEAEVTLGSRQVHVSWDRAVNQVFLTGPAELLKLAE